MSIGLRVELYERSMNDESVDTLDNTHHISEVKQ